MTQGQVFQIQSKRHGTRTFHRVGIKPYQRANGTMTLLNVWRSDYVKCGAPFHITAPSQASKSNAFGVFHCPKHRLGTPRTDKKPKPSTLDRLLRRPEILLPIVRHQQREANRAAEVGYFTTKGQTNRLEGSLIVLSGNELIEIDYQQVKTPEV